MTFSVPEDERNIVYNNTIIDYNITSGVIQRQLRRPFHKTSSKIVLNGGLDAGIGA